MTPNKDEETVPAMENLSHEYILGPQLSSLGAVFCALERVKQDRVNAAYCWRWGQVPVAAIVQ